MKRIAVVTDTGKTMLGEALCRDLEEVLGGHAEVRTYAFEELKPGDEIEADVALAMIKSRVIDLKNYVPEARKILVVRRTIQERMIYPIFAIPPGTRVLVVNNTPEATLDTVALLQQLEINHLQFIPYRTGMDCSDIKIAITPGEKQLVPEYINTVIDLGHRCVDTSTFIEVINRIGLADREVDRKLFKYSEKIVPLDMGVNHQYKELYLRNNELDSVLNLAHEGILFVNSDGKVAVFNRAFAAMLDIQDDITGAPLSILPTEIQEALCQESEQDWMVEYKGRSLIVSKKAIELFEEPAGSCFNVQEVTYIRQLEQNLSQKLREKGLTARYTFKDVLTRSPRMAQCLDLAQRISDSDFTVLILGESGTGKELLAQSIHNSSTRCKQPFVAMNCAAVPENLLESELFGYEGGAFTGALKEGKVGLFEHANHGTVFLDEIADMPLMFQAKLLRVLQERQVMRVGSQKIRNVNIRVIAATNHDLRKRIRAGRFREDLYYRLNTLPLIVPPLRDRPEDIFLLLEHFLAEHKRKDLRFSPEAREALLRYAWPGNIRELINVAGYLSFLTQGEVTLDALPYYLMEDGAETKPKEKAVRCGAEKARAVLQVLAQGERGLGRKSLSRKLALQGHAYSEAEVRSALRALDEAGLVASNMGRRGSELTPKGRSFLEG